MKLDKSFAGNWFAKYEHNCKHDIAESYVTALTMDQLLDMAEDPKAARERLLSMKLTYSDRFGLIELREAFSTMYGDAIGPDNIITGHGGVGANQIAYSSVYEPGDNLICVLPTYQQLKTLPSLIGYEVREYWLKPENNYDLDYDEIRSMMDERTKMICLTNPNNPSGRLFKREELARLAEVARERDAYVLSDEIYMGVPHIDYKQVSMAEIYEKGISTCSMSKTFSLPGLRIGWVVCPNTELVKEMVEYRHYYTMEMGVVDEYLASIAIRNRDKIISRNRSVINANLEQIDAWVAREECLSFRRPDTGSVAIIKYDLPVSSVDFCRSLVEETGFLIMPGYAFGMENHFRIGMVSPPEITREAIDVITQHMRRYQK